MRGRMYDYIYFITLLTNENDVYFCELNNNKNNRIIVSYVR